MKRALICLCVLLWPGLCQAGPWTLDQGHFYLNVGYMHLDTDRYYGPDFSVVPLGHSYALDVVGLYGEVGLISRWLTATVDATLFRRNHLVDQGITQGIGDWRAGLWTGILTRPVRLSFGLTVGIPLGDPEPSAGSVGPMGSVDCEARRIARLLPTGDGEWDLEGRLSLGYSFGGVRRWPLRHYLIAEAGYWLHTGFGGSTDDPICSITKVDGTYPDDFVYRLQFGIQFPWRFVDRFWLSLRLVGVESFASNLQASKNPTGLGPGVTFVSPGFELYGRIVAGLGASFGMDGTVRGRSISDAYQFRVTLSYQR